MTDFKEKNKGKRDRPNGEVILSSLLKLKLQSKFCLGNISRKWGVCFLTAFFPKQLLFQIP
jgi:hypothetical protein